MSAKPLSVLIIDDDALDRRLLAGALRAERPDITVLEAADGRAGLSLARQASPDVVVLDVRMPGLDGFEVLGALPSAGRAVMLSSSARPSERRRAARLGARAYLTKPDTRAGYFTITSCICEDHTSVN